MQWIFCPKTSMYLPWWTVYHLLQYIKVLFNIIEYKYIIILDPLHNWSSVPYKEQLQIFDWYTMPYSDKAGPLYWEWYWSKPYTTISPCMKSRMSSILSPIYMAMPVSPIFESVAISLSDPQTTTSVEEPGTYGFTKVSTTNFTFRLEWRY